MVPNFRKPHHQKVWKKQVCDALAELVAAALQASGGDNAGAANLIGLPTGWGIYVLNKSDSAYRQVTFKAPDGKLLRSFQSFAAFLGFPLPAKLQAIVDTANATVTDATAADATATIAKPKRIPLKLHALEALSKLVVDALAESRGDNKGAANLIGFPTGWGIYAYDKPDSTFKQVKFKAPNGNILQSFQSFAVFFGDALPAKLQAIADAANATVTDATAANASAADAIISADVARKAVFAALQKSGGDRAVAAEVLGFPSGWKVKVTPRGRGPCTIQCWCSSETKFESILALHKSAEFSDGLPSGLQQKGANELASTLAPDDLEFLTSTSSLSEPTAKRPKNGLGIGEKRAKKQAGLDAKQHRFLFANEQRLLDQAEKRGRQAQLEKPEPRSRSSSTSSSSSADSSVSSSSPASASRCPPVTSSNDVMSVKAAPAAAESPMALSTAPRVSDEEAEQKKAADVWSKSFDKTHDMPFWFNRLTKESVWDRPDGAPK